MTVQGLAEGFVVGPQGPLPVIPKLRRYCYLKGVQATSVSFTRVKDTNLAHWNHPESLKAKCLCPGLTPKEFDLIGEQPVHGDC